MLRYSKRITLHRLAGRTWVCVVENFFHECLYYVRGRTRREVLEKGKEWRRKHEDQP